MTDSTTPSPSPGKPIFELPEVRSYWEQTTRAFVKNKLAVLGLFVVFLVATIGVFCPLIANHRPLYLKMVFEDQYDENYFIVLDVMDQFLDRGPEPDAERALSNRRALDLAMTEMRESLEANQRTRLDEFKTTFDQFIANPTNGSGETAQNALDAIEEEFDIGEVKLVPVVQYPAIRGLGRGEVVFIFLYVFTIALFFARKRLRTLPRYLLAVSIPTAICSIAWLAIFPPIQDTFPYRQHLEAEGFGQRGEKVIRTLVPYGENENITRENRQPPTWMMTDKEKVEDQHFHLLGTDTNGRDVLSRMTYGARISMLVGIVAVSIYVTIGIILGALAGYFGGWIDLWLSRMIEIVICFPVLFLILSVQAFTHPSIINIMIALGLVSWTGVARLQRGEFLRIVNLDFVTAVRALGGSSLRIIFLHVLPNALGPILVLISFGIAGSILVESTLSFLGFGVPQPTASWGDLLNNGRNDIQGTWWLTVFPGIAIFLTVTCFNLLGEGVRDALDPKRQ